MFPLRTKSLRLHDHNNLTSRVRTSQQVNKQKWPDELQSDDKLFLFTIIAP